MKTQVRVFTAENQTLTIACSKGKSGYNVKASVKTGKGKGSPKAVTGGRGSFQSAEEAESAMKALIEQAEEQGWTSVDKRVRNAFTEIPAPRLVKKDEKNNETVIEGQVENEDQEEGEEPEQVEHPEPEHVEEARPARRRKAS